MASSTPESLSLSKEAPKTAAFQDVFVVLMSMEMAILTLWWHSVSLSHPRPHRLPAQSFFSIKKLMMESAISTRLSQVVTHILRRWSRRPETHPTSSVSSISTMMENLTLFFKRIMTLECPLWRFFSIMWSLITSSWRLPRSILSSRSPRISTMTTLWDPLTDLWSQILMIGN